MRSLPAFLVATITLGACESPVPPASFAVRDSAGVEVVESYPMEWAEGREWRVGPEALLRIGVVEGDPAHILSGVVGALRLDDGTVVVADAGSSEVRFFDATGSILGIVGGRGEGPGEFSGLTGIGRGPSGLVWAYDFMLRRITWIEPPGRIRGSTSLGPEPPMLNAVGALADGSFVLKQLWGARQVAEAMEGGLRRDRIAYVRVDTAGLLRDTVVLTPGRELVLTEEDGRGVMGTPPFARNSVGAVRERSVIVGSQDRFELDEYAADGTLLRRVRIPDRDLAVRPEEVEAHIEERVAEAAPERRPAVRRSLEAAPLRATRPAYGAVLVDGLDHVWVGEWAMLPRIAREWTVLGPDGRWLGTVEVPDRFELLDIGADWIVGLSLDELDVQTVAVYPLMRLERATLAARAKSPRTSPTTCCHMCPHGNGCSPCQSGCVPTSTTTCASPVPCSRSSCARFWERLYLDSNGDEVVDGSGLTMPGMSPGPGDQLPRFVFKSPTPDHWIPYEPRRESPQSPLDGEIHLRRASTREDATASIPQYHSKVVAESSRLNEEEVPRTGLRVRRIVKHARGSDGKSHFWVGRLKEPAQRTKPPQIRTDYIEGL